VWLRCGRGAVARVAGSRTRGPHDRRLTVAPPPRGSSAWSQGSGPLRSQRGDVHIAGGACPRWSLLPRGGVAANPPGSNVLAATATPLGVSWPTGYKLRPPYGPASVDLCRLSPGEGVYGPGRAGHSLHSAAGGGRSARGIGGTGDAHPRSIHAQIHRICRINDADPTPSTGLLLLLVFEKNNNEEPHPRPSRWRRGVRRRTI